MASMPESLPRARPGVEVFTDGACSGNPGPGGWGALLRYGEVEKELYGGGGTPTTKNPMGPPPPIPAPTALTPGSARDPPNPHTDFRNRPTCAGGQLRANRSAT